jgi:hypothetical protein
MSDTRTGRGVSRRAALRTLGAGAGMVTLLPWLSDEGLLAFGELQKKRTAPALKVLTAPQYATLETLVETIIPTDERSPGAKEARVADFIDLLMFESEPEQKQPFLEGLAALDAESTTRFKAPFAKLSAEQAEALLTDISQNEKAPTTPLEIFFRQAKTLTISGYYTSEIGIHKELRYKGNVYTPEFIGCLTEDGKDCPHCGQKAVS